MDKTFELICVGDAIVDAFLTIQNENSHIRLDQEKNELCIKSGEKILLDDYVFLLGGNACNVSVGASRLGLKTSFCAELGDDDFSKRIIDGLRKEKIDMSFLRQTQDENSSLSVVINFKSEKTVFVNHVERSHDFSLDGAKTGWVFLTSIGKEWKRAYQNILNFVKQNNAKLAFNPGTPQIEEGVESFLDILESSETVFVNKQEAQHLISDFNENDIKNLLTKVKSLGPKMVVLTDGKNGSYIIGENGKTYRLGIFPANVLQKAGAGDAYTSGFLTAIISGKSIEEAMRWGSANAAGVIEKTGAQAGLLTKEEMERKLEENKNIKAEEI